MSFDVDIGHASERAARAVNEDFAAAARHAPHEEALGFIAAIADGVSTGGQGLMAAQTSVMALVEDYFAAPATWDTTVVLDRVIGAHNSWLSAHNRRNLEAAMSTLTAVALRGHTWTLAHVGDTRAYLLRGDECRRLTQDHALDHPDLRSQLTRAMGLDDAVRVDYLQGDLHLGDCFVLLTDGVHGKLAVAQIQALAAQGTAQQASVAIVRAAVAAGTQDNATALVVRVQGLARARLEDAVLSSRQLPVPRRLRVGESIDGFVVTALVADTGVHLLYQLRDPASGALKALKTLHPSRAGDPQERAMLAHEAWLSERVSDRGEPGFVRLNPVPDATGFYLLYDWHSGQTLEQLFARRDARGLAVADVVAWSLAGARGLGRLHRLGVIHRDVKPGNLHLGEDGQLRLLDLGVALSGNETAEQRDLHAGTPSYMNPELWDGARADARSDLFALGVTMYQLLTGHLPYGEIEPYQTMRYRRDAKPLSRLRPDVPIWLDHLVLKAVARDPKARFETAEELAIALERGASRPLSAPLGTPLLARDPAALWQIGFAVSLLLNLLLVYWLLFLPR
ncbi:MAG: bifunctional protein-serine/threonine kinase/phosphatase [Burkholderiales bacterium]|nr:bifunctional protein-serine/threonine kinase/phosphatase [Burkholderiales bacterium]